MSDHKAATDARDGGRVAAADTDKPEPDQDEREPDEAAADTDEPEPDQDEREPDEPEPDQPATDAGGAADAAERDQPAAEALTDADPDSAETPTDADTASGDAPADSAPGSGPADSAPKDAPADNGSMDVTLVAVSAGGPVSDPADDAILASAPGVGTRVGAVNVTTLGPFGWVVMAAGIVGTLLIAVSYLAGWLTASLENFGVAETESLGLEAATSTPLAWMYRLATLALIGCATGLVFAPRSARPLLRLGGFTAAGLSLFTALIATLVIATALARGSRYFGDASSVGYGWGFYCGFVGIVALTLFVGLFQRIAAR